MENLSILILLGKANGKTFKLRDSIWNLIWDFTFCVKASIKIYWSLSTLALKVVEIL